MRGGGALSAALRAAMAATAEAHEAERAADRASDEAAAQRRLEKLLRAAARKSEKDSREAASELSERAASHEHTLAAKGAEASETRELLQSARAGHRVALEQLRQKLGAQEDEAAELEDVVTQQRRRIATLTSDLATRERELERAAAASPADRASDDAAHRVALAALTAQLGDERAAVAQLRAQHAAAMSTSVEGLLARHAEALRAARAAHATECGAAETRVEERLRRTHRAAADEAARAAAAAAASHEARAAQLDAQLAATRGECAAAKREGGDAKALRAAHDTALGALKAEHLRSTAALEHAHGVARQGERTRTLARMQKHSLAITKQCDASLVAAAAQHRALAAKLAGLHEQSVELSALRPKAAERDALARERDEALAALAAEREEAARLAAELAAAVARGAAAHAKERAATRATEDAHIALAEAKAKVASLTERSAREIEGAGSFCFLSCLSSSSFFFLTLSASFFLLSFFFLLVKSARRG